MTTPPQNPQHSPEERLPDLLERALRDQPQAPIEVDESVDEAIRAAAKAHFARSGAAGSTRPRFFIGSRLAAAAVLLIVAGVGIFFLSDAFDRPDRSVRPPIVQQADPNDLNQDGVVDIVDALRLAQIVEDDQATGGKDINGDGRIDQADVEALAADVVRLIQTVAQRFEIGRSG